MLRCVASLPPAPPHLFFFPSLFPECVWSGLSFRRTPIPIVFIRGSARSSTAFLGWHAVDPCPPPMPNIICVSCLSVCVSVSFSAPAFSLYPSNLHLYFSLNIPLSFPLPLSSPPARSFRLSVNLSLSLCLSPFPFFFPFLPLSLFSLYVLAILSFPFSPPFLLYLTFILFFRCLPFLLPSPCLPVAFAVP